MSMLQTVPFQAVIPANTQSYFEFVLPADGTIDNLKMCFAVGQRFELRLDAVIIQSGAQLPTALISYAPGCDKYVAGDNVDLDIRTIQPVNLNDRLRLYYSNVSNAALHLACYVTIDYYGDKRRVV